MRTTRSEDDKLDVEAQHVQMMEHIRSIKDPGQRDSEARGWRARLHWFVAEGQVERKAYQRLLAEIYSEIGPSYSFRGIDERRK